MSFIEPDATMNNMPLLVQAGYKETSFSESNFNEDSLFQLKMLPLVLDNLITIDDATRQKVYEMGQRGGGGVNSQTEGGPDGSGDKKKRVWGVGEMDFEALMRMLDNGVSFCKEQEDFFTLLL